MKLLNELTIRNLKRNKKRTMVTIIGIFLSTFLVALVAGMGSSLLKSLEINGIEERGNYHIYISNVKKEEFSLLAKNREVDGYFYFSEVGVSPLSEEAKKEAASSKPYLQIVGFSENTKENFPIQLVEGRLPVRDGELLLTVEYANLLEDSIKVGDTLTLDVGIRTDLEGNRLSRNDSLKIYNSETREETIKDYEKLEKITDSGTKTYKVVGIAELQEMILGWESNIPYYEAYTVISSPQDYSDMYLHLKHPRNYENILNRLASSLSSYVPCTENNWCSGTNYNDMVLTYMLGSLEGNMAIALLGFLIIILAIVIAVSVVTIRNSFSISTSERYRQFGMLSSVGATRKQLFTSILLEGIFLGIIAIPPGLLLGAGSVYGMVRFLNSTLADFMARPFFHFYLPLWAFLLMIASIFLVVFLSTLTPAFLASKMTVLDAINSSTSGSFKKKKLKVPKPLKRIFGIGGEIAYKNMQRSKKRYKTTVLSIIVSVCTFISMFYAIHVFYTVETLYLKGVTYDIYAQHWLGDSNESEKQDELYGLKDYLEQEELVDRMSISSMFRLEILESNIWNDTFQESKNREILPVLVMKLGEQEYRNFLKQIGEREENLEGAILIDDVTFSYGKPKKTYILNSLKIKEGDVIKVAAYDYDSEFEEDQEVAKIKIRKRTSIHPLAIPLGPLDNETAYLIVSDAYFDELREKLDTINDSSYADIYIQSKEPEALIEKLEARFPDMYFENYSKQARLAKTVKFVVSCLLYGFIGIIALIGVTSIFNTITTNMILRSREFAMLEAVGMTKKEFHHMIQLESIFIGVKSLVIGIFLGLGLSYILHQRIVEGLDFPYQIPWIAIILSILFVTLLITVIMNYSIRKIRKQNIIETIREENI